LLDYGTITGPQGITFTGFIAAVRHQYQTIPELALDSGTLTQPDGRVFTGEFSIIFPEGSALSFSQIPVGAQLPFSLSPHIFRGTISFGTSIDPQFSAGTQVWAVENFLKHQNVTDVSQINRNAGGCGNCGKIFLFIFMTPFYCVFPLLIILPIIVGVPFMYAFLLPFGLIWISMLIFGI
jgi:hypothetical protein